MIRTFQIGIGLLTVSMLISPQALGQTSTSPRVPRQPTQPLRGPGGSGVAFQGVGEVKINDGSKGGWMFLPKEPSPDTAPVVIFCHGWSAMWPRGYQAWIDHLVKRGNIVIWPNYQDSLRTPTRDFLPNAIAGVKAGLSLLDTGKYGTKADLTRVAVVGHSAGGMIAAGLATSASANGLPKIKALMPVEPGDSQRGSLASIPLADLSNLPSDTLMIVLVGEEDTSVGTHDGERILHESVTVPTSNKALFMLHSDAHGYPPLVANHLAPSAMLNSDSSLMSVAAKTAIGRNSLNIGVVDALDYLGTWRLLDDLLDAAFAVPRPAGIFEDENILFMGKWSDGVPIAPLTRLN